MKKEIVIYSVLILSIMTLFAFELQIEEGEGKTGLKIVNTEAFDQLDIRFAANVYLIKGDQPKVVMEGNPEILNRMASEVINGSLVIRMEKPNKLGEWLEMAMVDDNDLKIYITTNDIEGIKITDSDNRRLSRLTSNGDRAELIIKNSVLLSFTKSIAARNGADDSSVPQKCI